MTEEHIEEKEGEESVFHHQKDEATEFIQSLARAARAFITYDARNEAVRRLLADFKASAQAALVKHGDLRYSIAPYEILFEDRSVYREEDRERSLAFRLFRDGVRTLDLKANVKWSELVKLLEILSVRYTGIRQCEDDTLTLLLQANFEEIEFDVVEAYVPSEEDPEEIEGETYHEVEVSPPAGWDQPLPQLGAPISLSYKELNDETKKTLQAEYSSDSMVRSAVQAVKEMLDIAKSSNDVAVVNQVMSFIQEVCQYLVVELRAAELVSVVRHAEHYFPGHPKVKAIKKDFGGGDILDRFLRDPDEFSADSLVPLFSMVGEDQLDRIVDRFVNEEDPKLRIALRKILSRLAMGKPDPLFQRLGDIPTDRMVDLFNVICVVAPAERALEAAYSMVEHESPDVQLGALEFIAMDSYTQRFHDAINRLLSLPTPRVRVRAASIFSKKCGRRGFPLLRETTEQLVKSDALEDIEAAMLGKALMRSSRELSLPLMSEWIKPKGFKGVFRKVSQGKAVRILRIAAIEGLASDPTEQGRALIAWLAAKDKDLRSLCEEKLKLFPSSEEIEKREQALKEINAKAREEKRKRAHEKQLAESGGKSKVKKGVHRGSARKD